MADGTKGIGGIPAEGYPQIVELPSTGENPSPSEGFEGATSGSCLVCGSPVWMKEIHRTLLRDAKYLLACRKCATRKREEQSRA